MSGSIKFELNWSALELGVPTKPYRGPLTFSCISTYGLHEIGIVARGLPASMELADIKKYFSAWGDVGTCSVLKSNGASKTGFINFRPPPLTLEFMDHDQQPVHQGVRGRTLEIDFTSQTAKDLQLREKGELKKRVIYTSANCFDMGTFLRSGRFLRQWRATNQCLVEINLNRRIIFLRFHHENDDYQIGIRFGDVHRQIVLDSSEEDVYVMYIQTQHPPFMWRRQEEPARSTPRSDNWCEENSWVRVPYIVDQRDDNDARISIGDFGAYRVCVPSINSYGELFKDCINDLMRFNLTSNKTNASIPSVVDTSTLPVIDIHSSFPFELAYLTECLIRAQKLSLYNISEEWVAFINGLDIAVAKNVLMRMTEARDVIEDPMVYSQRVLPELSSIMVNLKDISAHNIWVRRAVVTPSKIHLLPPTLELSNRVLRHFHQYQESFIRVTFSDEHFEKLGSSRELYQTLLDRFEEVLTEGFDVANRHYRFLAFSSSQLREHSCWFFADTPDGMDVNVIRGWMGDFSEIKNVAKQAARMGQCFSSTRAVKILTKKQIKEIPDITRNRYIFSDGIGKIAMSLATEIASIYNRDIIPGAFQIRLGGYKGVLAVAPDDEMDGYLVHLRPSQLKFKSDHTALEIIRTAEYIPAYLNRQIIVLLTTLGVPDQVFVDMHEKFLQEVDGILSNEGLSLKLLALHYSSSWVSDVLRKMVLSGFLRLGDTFTKNLLSLLKVQVLKDIKERARIPIEQGAHLTGVLDETNTLRENQVAVRFTDPHDPSTIRSYVGPVLVLRSPCLHPGDVHMAEAVDCPQLHSLVNCIAFSTQGRRDLPSQCSGGDLDGDTYMAIWDERLFPLQEKHPSSNASQEEISDQEITIRDTVDFFLNYIITDNLGEIANSHLAWADQTPESALSVQCVLLSQLHDQAVDFIKTGVPAEMVSSLRPSVWPDFMNKLPRKSYESTKALGVMYRSGAKRLSRNFKHTGDLEVRFDEKLVVPGYEAYIVEARRLKHEYDIILRDLMNQYEIKTEGEVISGYIRTFPSMASRKKDKFVLRETLGNVVNAIWKAFREKFDDFSAAAADDQWRRRKASAWYYVTCHPDEIELQKNREYWGVDDTDTPVACATIMHRQDEKPTFLSFPWIVHDILRLILESENL